MAALIIRLPDGKRERLKDLARALAEYDAETRFRARAGNRRLTP